MNYEEKEKNIKRAMAVYFDTLKDVAKKRDLIFQTLLAKLEKTKIDQIKQSLISNKKSNV